MKRLILLLLASAFAVSGTTATATTAESWALCNTCSTQSQFENAAIAWVGNRIGTFEVEIGNVYTYKVYRVSITNSAYPSNPAGSQGGSFRNADGHLVLVDPIEQPLIVLDGSNAPAGFATVDYAMEESQDVQDQFRDIVRSHGKQPLIAPGPKNAGFSSFADRLNPAVCAVGNSVMGQINPAWQAGTIAPASLGRLLGVLGHFYGRGPTVHVIFNNGDVASFQLNALVPSACRYLDGTAKDRDGSPLHEEGGIPGNGGGVVVSPHSGSNQVSYTQGSHWLVCAFVGDVLIGCYEEFVPG